MAFIKVEFHEAMPAREDRVAARFIDDVGFLGTNLCSEDTGVNDTVIWLFAGEFSRTESQHGPRIQVALGRKLTVDSLADSVSVTIAAPPEVLNGLPEKTAMQVVAFVKTNHDALLRHWHGEIDSGDVIELLNRV